MSATSKSSSSQTVVIGQFKDAVFNANGEVAMQSKAEQQLKNIGGVGPCSK